MTRVKMLRKNETAIIDNGKSYVFGLDGKCCAEDAGNLNSYMEGACDLCVVSILSSGSHHEVGVVFRGADKIKRYETTADLMTTIANFQMARGFVKMLRRTGMSCGVRFNQLLFVYPEGYDVMPILSKVGAKEAN